MISKADKYLSGWKASLLNTMGRAVLADSVLGNLLVYAMGALRLPKGTLAALEGKRRTFVWTGSEHASGAHCLVAWEQVCVPKELGGLGLKNLSVQNQCLLLKLIHRLHHPGASSWARWARQHVCLASLDGEVQGNHWDMLRELLPLYRVITTVRVHNGRSTSFWDDSWLGDEPLSEIHPALHSHATKPHATVAEVLQLGIDQFLQSRRTIAATADYTALAPLLATVLPGSGEDERVCKFQKPDGSLNTSSLYKALMAAHTPSCEFASFVWKNRAPPRVQFFVWLLMQRRIQSRSNLLKKSIITDDTCELCKDHPETVDHIVFHCPVAAAFWRQVGFELNAHATVETLQSLTASSPAPNPHGSVFLFLCCWNIWKHRNRVVFDGAEPCLQRLLRNCNEDARLWAWRLPRADAGVIESWCNLFSPM